MAQKARAEGTTSTTASAAAGKAPAASKTTVAKSAATVEPQCDWGRSSFSKREGNKLHRLGLIPQDEGEVKIPGADSRPNPPPGFHIMFAAFLYHGLSLPAHEFLRGILFTYGVQLWQLTPNSILHLAIFITLCESFLGVDPHFGLWKKIFAIKRHNNKKGPFVIGGVDFTVRKDVKYFEFPMRESV